MDGGRVLVAEDSESIRALVRAVLEERGFEVIDAIDGAEALERARETEPDVVLMDIDMPSLDGFETLEKMQADETLALIPVVFVTGRDSAAVDALERGGHDFIRKPFDADELVARVRAAVRVRRLQDELRALNLELVRMACTDVLTELYNRRSLDLHIEREVSAAARHGGAVSVLIIDVDHFKLINDEHGHHAGDRVLQEIARRMLRRVRREDLLGRWGGEEFMLVASGTGEDGAQAVGESLRAAVAADPVVTLAGAFSVTVSVGWASYDGDSPESLVMRADTALYAAKDAGRNVVRGGA